MKRYFATFTAPPPRAESPRHGGWGRHFARVNVLNDAGVWDQRAFVSFLTPDCGDLARF